MSQRAKADPTSMPAQLHLLRKLCLEAELGKGQGRTVSYQDEYGLGGDFGGRGSLGLTPEGRWGALAHCAPPHLLHAVP